MFSLAAVAFSLAVVSPHAVVVSSPVVDSAPTVVTDSTTASSTDITLLPHIDFAHMVATALQSGQNLADWQRQYDAARSRRTSGLHKLLYGVILDGAGVVLLEVGVNRCVSSIFNNSGCNTGSNGLEWAGLGTAAAGGVAFWWGIFQYFGANGDVHSLEATKPKSALFPIGEHQGIDLKLGAQSAVSYHINW